MKIISQEFSFYSEDPIEEAKLFQFTKKAVPLIREIIRDNSLPDKLYSIQESISQISPDIQIIGIDADKDSFIIQDIHSNIN